MLAFTNPRDAYRRSEVDARIRGTSTAQLVTLCCEQVTAGLGLAVAAHRRDDPAGRSRGLTQALSALTALELGVDRERPMAEHLVGFYAHARQVVLDGVPNFDPVAAERLRSDFAELSVAFAKAA